MMNKPGPQAYEQFAAQFEQASRKAGKKQYLLPYFMSGHPGSGLQEMLQLAQFIRDKVHFEPDQAQSFTPTPMTLSTAMYYTGHNPYNGKKVYVARSPKDRRLQRAILQSGLPRNRRIIREAIAEIGDAKIKADLAALLGRKGKGRGAGWQEKVILIINHLSQTAICQF